ncbi:MAG: methyltransferase, partial [Cyanobacteria bacterium P01_D01_bin.73]
MAWGGPLARPALADAPALELQENAPSSVSESLYTSRDRPSSDGIGKVYLGREIAKVMGYEGAGWLERAGRESQEKPSAAIAALNLRPTDTVVDIGAGTGYFSTRIASQVPQGQVLALDVQPEMIDILDWMKAEYQLDNLQPVLGTETDPNLPEQSVDVALMVDVYHELAYPNEVMQKVVRSLKPDGRIVVLEYRAENPLVLIKRLHKMSLRQLKKEMKVVGLELIASPKILPQQH